jgi:hypothetical protein
MNSYRRILEEICVYFASRCPSIAHPCCRLRSFMPYASDFGFLLDYNRFSNTLSADPSQIAPSLLSSIYLFGSYLSPSKELSAMQPAFLSRSIHDAIKGFSLSNPQRVLYCLQAECLLAQYLFIQGRILEGKYRISTAVSIILGSGFHKIRSAEQLNWSSRASASGSGVGVNALPPPRDVTEEGERINALWSVLILNHCWTAADGSPSNISYDVPESRIDTPWPLDTGNYAQVRVHSLFHQVKCSPPMGLTRRLYQMISGEVPQFRISCLGLAIVDTLS